MAPAPSFNSLNTTNSLGGSSQSSGAAPSSVVVNVDLQDPLIESKIADLEADNTSLMQAIGLTAAPTLIAGLKLSFNGQELDVYCFDTSGALAAHLASGGAVTTV